MDLAQRIQHLRKEKGLSQEELAEALGVSRQAVSKWESTQSTPDVEKIVAMSRYFAVTTDYLLMGVQGPEPNTMQAEQTKPLSGQIILCVPDGHGADFGHRQLVRGADGDLRLGRLDASSVRRLGVWHRRFAFQNTGAFLDTVCQPLPGGFFAALRPGYTADRGLPRPLSIRAAKFGHFCRAVYGVCDDAVPRNEKAFGRRIEKEEAGCFLFFYAEINVGARTP